MAESSSSVPFWWIVLFVVLALGAGALAISSVGGSLISSPSVVVPAFGL